MGNLMIKMDCITNMHVGNGEVNYNIIDNEVEKDPVTGYPTINSSGVKGALREYFKQRPELKEDVNDMFGDDTPGKSTQGKIKVLGADMISLAVRASAGEKAFYNVTTNTMAGIVLDKISSLNIQVDKKKLCDKKQEEESVAVDGIELKKSSMINGLYEVEDEKFRLLALPVLARNKLDNGKSKNLWYEEVVPHHSQFAFAVMAEEADDNLLQKFKAGVDNQIIQFGGNASIGYGLCKISVLGE